MVEKREHRHGSLLWRLDRHPCNDEVFFAWLVVAKPLFVSDPPSPFPSFSPNRMVLFLPVGFWGNLFLPALLHRVLWKWNSDYENCASTQYSVTGSGAVVVNTTNPAGCGGTLTQPFCKIPLTPLTLSALRLTPVLSFPEDPNEGLVGSSCMPNTAMIYFQDTSLSTAYVQVDTLPANEELSYMLMATCANHWFLFQYLDPSTSLSTSFSSSVGGLESCASGISVTLSPSNPTVGIPVSTCATNSSFGKPPFLAFPDPTLPHISSSLKSRMWQLLEVLVQLSTAPPTPALLAKIAQT